jgi:hypothetical protein
MKNSVSKYSLAAFCLCLNFVAFAQPGSGSDTGNLENPDPSVAPIDDYIWVLVILGIILVAYTFRNNQKTV